MSSPTALAFSLCLRTPATNHGSLTSTHAYFPQGQSNADVRAAAAHGEFVTGSAACERPVHAITVGTKLGFAQGLPPHLCLLPHVQLNPCAAKDIPDATQQRYALQLQSCPLSASQTCSCDTNADCMAALSSVSAIQQA